MSDYSHLTLLKQCDVSLAELEHCLTWAEGNEQVAEGMVQAARREVHAIHGNMARLKRRRQEICDHPFAACNTMLIYGYWITTCSVCNKMIGTTKNENPNSK